MKKNFQKNIKKSFAFFLISFLFLTGILITRNEISAGEVSDIKFTPQLTIPGSNFEAKKEMKVSSEFTKDGVVYEQTTLFSEYVGSFYRYGITIVGLLATVMLMAGGIVWLTSTGNQSKITKAKEMIFGSLIGMGILYSSYLILNTINPDLVKLKPIEMIKVERMELGCCQEGRIDTMTSSKDCKGTFSPDKILNSEGKCENKVCCQLTNNTGIVVSCFDSDAKTCSSDKMKLVPSEVSCSKNNLCSEILDCSNEKEGAIVKKSVQTFYCYENKVVIGPAKEGELCGTGDNNTAGVCIRNDQSCDDTNQYGGRSCISPSLKCCINMHGGGGTF